MAYRCVKTDIKAVVFDIRKEENPCSLCAKLRRGALHDAAPAEGCPTVALGHHFDDAVEKAVWLEHGNRHSAHIHSKNIDNITKYAKAIDTAILVKNAPSYAALGFGGEGYCTFTIASRTGEGLTSASTFTKRRRCVMSDSLCIR